MPPAVKAETDRRPELREGLVATAGIRLHRHLVTAARALMAHSQLDAAGIVRESLKIAGEICIYSNLEITVLELGDETA